MRENDAYQSGFAKRCIAVGREEGCEEGRDAGHLRGQAESLPVARGLTPDAAPRERVLRCGDSALLRRRLTRAATATAREQVFTD